MNSVSAEIRNVDLQKVYNIPTAQAYLVICSGAVSANLIWLWNRLTIEKFVPDP